MGETSMGHGGETKKLISNQIVESSGWWFFPNQFEKICASQLGSPQFSSEHRKMPNCCN